MKKVSYVRYRPGKASDHLPMSVRSVGSAMLHRLSTITNKRKFDFIQFIWCEYGKGAIEWQNRCIEISEGYTGSILPGMEHQLYSLTPEWKIRWVTVDGIHACDILKSFGLDRKAVKSGECPFDLFTKLENSILCPNRKALLEASALCYELFSRAANGIPHESDLVGRAMAIMRSNAGDPNLGIAQVADQLGIERTLFSKKFLAQSGMSPKEYLDSCRLEKIMYFLANSFYSIKEISRRTGFANSNYMDKFFRKKMRMAPLVFRRQSLQEL